ncbi:MAG: thymidine phosphorylase [Spirochaetales bacterium]|nr:thymidine phosphorylase [Spirochaetales bacterium]
MRAVDLIIKKREGTVLTKQEIEYLIFGYIQGDIPDYQMSSFCMAVYFNGMTTEETHALTSAMLYSGEQINLSALTKPKIDKHSTGGVGDKISLILAPIAAACGLVVPMMCGRGLGHTGGTIDKMEAIPGYSTCLNRQQIEDICSRIGFVIMGQTDTIAPADKMLYALRDVSGTVESIPLITASILSKKLAEGADGFVFDVKAGVGAFMQDVAEATSLAGSLVSTTAAFGKPAAACITDMNAPLGRMIGNRCEVAEAYECLGGKMPDDIQEITFSLVSEMLILGNITDTLEKSVKLIKEKITDSTARNLFLENVRLQGGTCDMFLHDKGFTLPENTVAIKARKNGILHGIHACKIGIASMLLGAGRTKKTDDILPDAGVELFVTRGDAVKAGDELGILFSAPHIRMDEALLLAEEAFEIQDKPFVKKSLLLGKIDAHDLD